MQRSMRILFSALVAVVLASPVFGKPVEPALPPPPPFVESSVPEGKALVYIYRLEGFNDVLILARSGPIGRLPPKSYLSYTPDPETVKLWLTGTSVADLKMDVVAGQIYYVKAEIGPGLFFAGTWTCSLKLVPRADAMKEMAGLKQTE